MNLQIYTDGACINNPGIGGYAYAVYNDSQEICMRNRGFEKFTTNNKMELTAVIEALKVVDKEYGLCNITVCSDSAYIVNCFNDGWLIKWMDNGWLNSKKQPVLNRDMWETLNVLVNKMGVKFERVSRKDSRLKVVDKDANLALKRVR